MATAEESNAHYHYLLQQGQTALSVAFDLPTQMGYDSDHPLAIDEVGRVGVAVNHVGDMERLFRGLPLDRLSVNFTINATSAIILAYYLVTAELQDVGWDRLSGTLQNDILKEYLARGTYIFPPKPSLRIIGTLLSTAPPTRRGSTRSASRAITPAKRDARRCRSWDSRWRRRSRTWIRC